MTAEMSDSTLEKVIGEAEKQIRTDFPIAYYHSHYINTLNDVQIELFLIQSLTIVYPRDNAIEKITNVARDALDDVEDALEIGRKYSQPRDDTIKVIAPRLPISKHYPPRALRPLVEQGVLKISFAVVEDIVSFLTIVAQTPNVVYEVIDCDLLVVRDENNEYFDVIRTWSKEAEEEGWEEQAEFEAE